MPQGAVQVSSGGNWLWATFACLRIVVIIGVTHWNDTQLRLPVRDSLHASVGVLWQGRAGELFWSFSILVSPVPPCTTVALWGSIVVSDREDDFMCDDEEDYDLVRRRERAAVGSGMWRWCRGRATAASPRGASARFLPAGRRGSLLAWRRGPVGPGKRGREAAGPPRPLGPGIAQVAGRGLFWRLSARRRAATAGC